MVGWEEGLKFAGQRSAICGLGMPEQGGKRSATLTFSGLTLDLKLLLLVGDNRVHLSDCHDVLYWL